MTKPALLVALFCLTLFGCAASQQTLLNTDPMGYDDAMEKLAAELRTVDKHITGGQYDSAVIEAERAVHLAGFLERYEPPRMGKTFADYEEFQNQAIDMRRGTDRLMFLVQQRRREDANEQMVVVIERYNYLSKRYGPGIEIQPLARDQGGMRGPAGAGSNQPYNR